MDKEVVFERPPYSGEVFTKDNLKKFNEWPGQLRHFIKRLFETDGNWKISCEDAGIIKGTSKEVAIAHAGSGKLSSMLAHQGLSRSFILDEMYRMLTTKTEKADGKGNVVEVIDNPNRLKVIELVLKLNGDLGKDAQVGVEDTDIDELFPTTQ